MDVSPAAISNDGMTDTTSIASSLTTSSTIGTPAKIKLRQAKCMKWVDLFTDRIYIVFFTHLKTNKKRVAGSGTCWGFTPLLSRFGIHTEVANMG